LRAAARTAFAESNRSRVQIPSIVAFATIAGFDVTNRSRRLDSNERGGKPASSDSVGSEAVDKLDDLTLLAVVQDGEAVAGRCALAGRSQSIISRRTPAAHSAAHRQSKNFPRPLAVFYDS
jgi:hypothetical protein